MFKQNEDARGRKSHAGQGKPYPFPALMASR